MDADRRRNYRGGANQPVSQVRSLIIYAAETIAACVARYTSDSLCARLL